MDTKPIYIAAYGSLRLDEYNYNYFKSVFGDEFEYFRTVTTIKGFDLYSLGSYPAVIPNREGNEAPLIADIMKCSDRVHQFIKQMEEGAGYEERVLKMDFGDCYIYVYEDETISNDYFLVEDGNWSYYLKVQKKLKQDAQNRN